MSIDPRYAADVASVDAIVTAMYSTVSGPAGPRDAARERHLFHPEARLMRGLPDGSASEPASPTPGVKVFTVDQFVAYCTARFLDRDFYELEIGREEFRFGRWVHVVSAYQSRRHPDEPPFARGINSIQLWWDAGRWWIMNLIWDWESDAVPIPERLDRTAA